MNFSTLSRAVFATALASSVFSADSEHAQLGSTRAIANGAPGARAFAQTPVLNGALTVRTSVDEGGATLREYASSTGQIVAYSWSGPTTPDLHALLGAHFASYRAGAANAAATSATLHAGRVAQPDVVVESGGQMRSYVGRAWLPNALPAGVSLDDIR